MLRGGGRVWLSLLIHRSVDQAAGCDSYSCSCDAVAHPGWCPVALAAAATVCTAFCRRNNRRLCPLIVLQQRLSSLPFVSLSKFPQADAS